MITLFIEMYALKNILRKEYQLAKQRFTCLPDKIMQFKRDLFQSSLTPAKSQLIYWTLGFEP